MGQVAPIIVENLNHSYGSGELKKQILFSVSTEIRAGEIVIVTGPSGSGKTTLLTLVGALRSAQEGSVKVLGEDLLKAKPATLERVRRQIGFIFQQHNLLGALTALQNVELAPYTPAIASPPRSIVSGPAKCLVRSAWANACITVRISSPAGSGNAWPSPAPWSPSRPS